LIIELSDFFNNPSLIEIGWFRIQYYAVTWILSAIFIFQYLKNHQIIKELKLTSDQVNDIVFLYGLIISIISNLLINEKETIFFGVLHFIGLSSLILDDDFKKVILVLVSSIIINNYMKNYVTNNILFLIFSGKIQNLIPLDTFQMLQWLPLFCIGIILGSFIKQNNIDFNINLNQLVKTVSKNSLDLYMINIIVSLIWYKLYVL